jgi:uncharacterized membrane protein
MSTAVRQDPPEAGLDASAHAAITIGLPADELRALWLKPQTQARIWAHFADITPSDDDTAVWIARGPASSEEAAEVPNAGTLTFRAAPGDRGTELHLDVRFDPPGGVVGEAVSKLFHIVPGEIVRTALYKFRALALTGEIPTTDSQPAARRGGSDR